MFPRLIGLIFLLLPFWGFTQDLTGIWKGYFTTGLGDSKRIYKYEIQIKETNNSHLSGVAYSYLNTAFYGKSTLSGSFQLSTKRLNIKEMSLLSVNGADRTDVCMMDNRFNYSKKGHTEQLEGTFTSRNMGTASECGQGYIFLQRVSKSDFSLEPFLAKGKSRKLIPKKNHLKKEEDYTKIQKRNLPVSKNLAKNNLTAIPSKSEKNSLKVKDSLDDQLDHSISNERNVNKTSFSDIPVSFMNRKNKIVKTIITSTPEVDISFYDNGEIDNDSITVYHNLNRIIEHGRLSRLAINYGFDASKEDPNHSFIIVADNLGKIPPNSALMVIYTNNERYEVFIESDMANNGEVRIIYQPKETK